MPRATLPFFFFNDTATTEIYTLSLHDALPISPPLDLVEHLGGRTRRSVAHGRAEALEGGLVGEGGLRPEVGDGQRRLEGADRKSTRLNSSHLVISYAVFCLKKKRTTTYSKAMY